MAGAIASEIQADTSYHHHGQQRKNERHCLFKYSLSGTGAFADANGERAVPPEHGFLCKINDPETSYYYPSWASEPWEFIYLCFFSDFSDAVVEDLVERFGPVLYLPKTSSVVKQLQGFKAYDRSTLMLSAAASADIVMKLLLALHRYQDERAKITANHVLVEQTMTMMRDSIHEPYNVSDYARRAGVSREHLTRVFTNEVGQTPAHYLKRQKMLIASQLLKETSMSSKEIASRLGFASAAHFNLHQSAK